MAVVVIDGSINIVRLTISADEIQGLLESHHRLYPRWQALELLGAELTKNKFNEPDSRVFVREVCEWGGGDRFKDRVIELNSPTDISSALRDAYRYANEGRVADAVERVQVLKHLGQSFASKQVRFLAPSEAVILDSIIRSRLGYEETKSGYDAFLDDCRAILALVQRDTAIDVGFRNSLRVCDIETALFAKLQGF